MLKTLGLELRASEVESADSEDDEQQTRDHQAPQGFKRSGG